jgi:6-phosphogluconolactonase
VSVLPDVEVLAATTAARFAIAIADAQAERGAAAVVLTGGTGAMRMYAALRDSATRHAVDWGTVDVWLGDERFLPSGHPDRNETQARAALLDALPVDPARVHPMPASDGADGADPVAAAARYAATLLGADGGPPPWDVLLLGVGEDGHIASVFPGHPLPPVDGIVAAVTGSPKPPPVRLTLTPQAIGTAREIWLIAAGDGKADAVAAALGDPVGEPLPAAAVRGTVATRWFIDRAAATRLATRRA